MSPPHPFALWALVVLASFAPTLGGCSSTPTTIAKPAARPRTPAPTQAAQPAADIVPVSFTGWDMPPPAREAQAPMTLTAADGTELKLRKVVSRSVVQGPLAFTEVRLAFENPASRVVEGRFRIALPTGAAVSRFAMMIQGSWQEGEVVEQRRARRTFEDFLHRKQDPALLEQSAGNEFSARVFPIAANSEKQLLLSYSQELTARSRTLLPLRGLPEVAEIDVAVLTPGAPQPVAAIQQASYTPVGDVVLGPQSTAAAQALRHGELVVARIHPPVGDEPDKLDSAVILVDTSASRALGLGAELALVAALVERVAHHGGAEAPLAIAGFDQTIAPVLEGHAGDFDKQQLDKLGARGALGASNLGAALRWAGSAAKMSGASRVVLISDGVATAGADSRARLRTAVKALGRSSVTRVDAIALGGIQDEPALDTIVTAGLTRDGIVVDGELPTATILAKLDRRTHSKVAVTVTGASWSWPRQLHGVQAGDEALIYATVPKAKPLQIRVAGVRLSNLRAVSVERPLLQRSWAQAKIQSLLERMSRGEAEAALRHEIVRLSTTFRVLSPYTSLLVLETEQDYRRFGLDRSALADILTIQNDRLAVESRSKPASTPAPSSPSPPELRAQAPQNPRIARQSSLSEAADFGMIGQLNAAGSGSPWGRDDALGTNPLVARGSMWGSPIGKCFPPERCPGAGGLGLTGIGEGGGGRGERGELGQAGSVGHGAGAVAAEGSGSSSGRRTRSHRARPPRVRMGATSVSGRLPPEIVQRTVRLNFGRLRGPYLDALRNNPTLRGRVVLRFVIGRDGSVIQARAQSSELDDATMLRALERAVMAVRFPQPEGGIVTVVYPVVFRPAGSEPRVASPQGPASTEPPSAPPPPKPAKIASLHGKLATVMSAIRAGRSQDALTLARDWRAKSPGDVLALVGLGEAFEASGSTTQAARAYGSIIDMFPARADLRRFAGSRLEHISSRHALSLAVDSYQKARKQRPDHPSSHRLLAFARLKQGKPAKAFAILRDALARRYPGGRFEGVDGVLREDLALAAAAWMRTEPKRRAEIAQQLEAAGGELDREPSLRFVLTWETDANDVDLHVHDASGGHAFYGHPELQSGGRLYADVTTGYGPECFTVRTPRAQRSPRYRLAAHYYSRGPMGYGMGKVQIIDHDGHGQLTFDERPFVVMNDSAFVDLGIFHSKPAASPKPDDSPKRRSSRQPTTPEAARADGALSHARSAPAPGAHQAEQSRNDEPGRGGGVAAGHAATATAL